MGRGLELVQVRIYRLAEEATSVRLLSLDGAPNSAHAQEMQIGDRIALTVDLTSYEKLLVRGAEGTVIDPPEAVSGFRLVRFDCGIEFRIALKSMRRIGFAMVRPATDEEQRAALDAAIAKLPKT